MKGIEDRLYELSKRCKLSIAGALSGLAAPAAKLAGDYLIFGKSLYDQVHNPEQLFNYGLMTAGAMTAMAAGGALVDRILKTNIEERYVDPLTGAYNYRYLKKTQEEIRLNSDNRDKTNKFAIAIIDLDNFKPVNDTFGHKMGDEVLANIVNEVFKSEMKRPGDKVFRIGGDEFMLYMPETDARGANAIIARMKERMQGMILGNIQVGFSVGIVSDDGSTDIEDLKVRADKIMYADKALKKKE